MYLLVLHIEPFGKYFCDESTKDLLKEHWIVSQGMQTANVRLV